MKRNADHVALWLGGSERGNVNFVERLYNVLGQRALRGLPAGLAGDAANDSFDAALGHRRDGVGRIGANRPRNDRSIQNEQTRMSEHLTMTIGDPVLGIIGPTRLNYARIVPMVDYTAQVVGRLLGGSAAAKAKRE